MTVLRFREPGNHVIYLRNQSFQFERKGAEQNESKNVVRTDGESFHLRDSNQKKQASNDFGHNTLSKAPPTIWTFSALLPVDLQSVVVVGGTDGLIQISQ